MRGTTCGSDVHPHGGVDHETGLNQCRGVRAAEPRAAVRRRRRCPMGALQGVEPESTDDLPWVLPARMAQRPSPGGQGPAGEVRPAGPALRQGPAGRASFAARSGRQGPAGRTSFAARSDRQGPAGRTSFAARSGERGPAGGASFAGKVRRPSPPRGPSARARPARGVFGTWLDVLRVPFRALNVLRVPLRTSPLSPKRPSGRATRRVGARATGLTKPQSPRVPFRASAERRSGPSGLTCPSRPSSTPLPLPSRPSSPPWPLLWPPWRLPCRPSRRLPWSPSS